MQKACRVCKKHAEYAKSMPTDFWSTTLWNEDMKRKCFFFFWNIFKCSCPPIRVTWLIGNVMLRTQVYLNQNILVTQTPNSHTYVYIPIIYNFWVGWVECRYEYVREGMYMCMIKRKWIHREIRTGDLSYMWVWSYPYSSYFRVGVTKCCRWTLWGRQQSFVLCAQICLILDGLVGFIKQSLVVNSAVQIETMIWL